MKRLLLYMVLCLAAITNSGCGYNTMQKNEEAVKAAWGNVEAAYQRRNDLIPNLVETVKAYAKYEGETLKAVTEARAKVGSVQISPESSPAATSKRKRACAPLASACRR